MFLTSQEKNTMTSRGSSESERQNLLDRLLDAVKQCQVRFGGKTELATDADSRVSCLLAQLLSIFNHGLKKPKGTVRAFMQVGQVTGIAKQGELDPAFYNFVKEHLVKNEQERFLALQNITTDAGRGRAWLRSTLNEHTLEKNIHSILGNKQLLGLYYEPDAFLLDEEKSSMLPMIAAGLSSILFALGIDNEELNNVKQVSPHLPSTKEVFSNLLSSFPAAKPKPEPVAVLAESTRQDSTKKKKKKKNAAIVTIDDGDSNTWESTGEPNLSDPIHHDAKDFPLNDTTIVKVAEKTTNQGHSRSTSYPFKFELETSDISNQTLGSSLPNPNASGSGFRQHRILREFSLSDSSLIEERTSDVKWINNSTEESYEGVQNPNLEKTCLGQSIDPIQQHQNKEFKGTGSPVLSGVHGNAGTMKTDGNVGDENKGSNVESGKVLMDHLHKETQDFYSVGSADVSNEKIKEEKFFSVKSFIHSKQRKYTNPDEVEKSQSLESDLSTQDILSTSVSKDVDSFLVTEGEDGLMFLGECEDIKTLDSSESKAETLKNQGIKDKEDGESSKDSVSLSSNSWLGDNDEREEQSEEDFLSRVRSESMSAATDAAAAALELCTPSSEDILGSDLSNRENTAFAGGLPDQCESMTTNELKQAIVSMMLRKDEIEDQNRVLHQLMEEKRNDKEVVEAEMDRIKQENKIREDQDNAKIKSLTRENEVLKHQLKKYVGAVQMLKNSMSNKASDNLQGIRQEEILPSVPDKYEQNEDREREAEEYKQKLIQVAEMHGELMEFNEHLQRQLNDWQAKCQRQQEELISLRGPLPEESTPLDSSTLSNIDANMVTQRPLINIWIPSVFLKGKGSAGVHHLYQVYVRIKDDEWNVYRRYSQFYELHKKGKRFVEERRKVLQEYIRLVVNLLISTHPELATNACKTTLLDAMPFFGDFYPRNKASVHPRKQTEPYNGL